MTTAAGTFNWRRLLVGNWLGAGLTALAALLTTGVLGGVLALLAKPADLGVDNTLTLAAVIATAAFGADLTASFDIDRATGGASAGVFPLTVTIVTLAVAVLVFRRVVARYPTPYAALGDAARAALIFGIGLLVAALVFRSDNDQVGRGWATVLSRRNLGLETELGASAAGAFFLGFLILFVTLAASVFVRAGWWTGTVARVQAWVGPTLSGIATTFLLLPVAGGVGLAAVLLLGEDTVSENDPTGDDWGAIVATFAGLLANGGMWVVGLGSGASFGAESEETDDGGGGSTRTGEWHHLWGEITDSEPGLWVAPFVTVGVLLVSAFVVARRSSRERVLGCLLVWVASLVVVVPLLVRLSGFHGSLDVSDRSETYALTGYAGLNGLPTTLLLLVVGLLCAAFWAWRYDALRPAELRAQVSALARSFQSNPGRPTGPPPPSPPSGPPPTGPPPTGPPPTGPPPPPAWPPPDAQWDRLE